MHLDFEINHKNIRKINIKDDCSDGTECFFIFKNKEWRDIEKYVVFWDERNRSTIKYLGEGCKLRCKAPNNITENFSVQIYANDEYVTEKVKIGMPIGTKEEREYEYSQSIIRDIYSQLKQKIDKIIYKNNVLYFYANNKIIKSVELYNKDFLKSIIIEEINFNVDSKLSPTSKNPVQNKVITKELNKKSNLSELPRVALTGDYNDLENIPEEFTPKHHNHQMLDVVDYEESVDVDFERLLDMLSDEIVRE